MINIILLQQPWQHKFQYYKPQIMVNVMRPDHLPLSLKSLSVNDDFESFKGNDLFPDHLLPSSLTFLILETIMINQSIWLLFLILVTSLLEGLLIKMWKTNFLLLSLIFLFILFLIKSHLFLLIDSLQFRKTFWVPNPSSSFFHHSINFRSHQ